jgi:hypothetical protein
MMQQLGGGNKVNWQSQAKLQSNRERYKCTLLEGYKDWSVSVDQKKSNENPPSQVFWCFEDHSLFLHKFCVSAFFACHASFLVGVSLVAHQGGQMIATSVVSPHCVH